MTTQAYLYVAVSSDWRALVAADPQYTGLTADQVADKYNQYIEVTIQKFNDWVARECGVTMSFATLPDIPERLRPYVLQLDITKGQLGTAPEGNSILDQYGQGLHFTTLMESINRIAVARNAPIGNLVYQFTHDQWSPDRAVRNPREVRLYVVAPFDGGGYAGGQSGLANVPDNDITAGQGALGSWGPSYYVTGKPNPGCMAIYGIGLATQEPTRDLAHEMLHGMFVDSHVPVYLVLDPNVHWDQSQKDAFLYYNKAFLTAVVAPPSPPPPPPTPTLVSVAISGPSSVTTGTIPAYKATATYSDGSTKAITTGFRSSNSYVLNVLDNGKAAANNVGTADVLCGGGRLTVNVTKPRGWWWKWW